MVIPIILVFVIIFTLLIVLKVNWDDYDIDVFVNILLFLWCLFIIPMGIALFDFIDYKRNSLIIDDKIALVEEINKQRVESVIPILEKFPQMEKELIQGIDPNAFAILGDVYPNLKSNENYKQQAQLILDNIKEVENLKRDKINLKSRIQVLNFVFFMFN